MLESRRGKSVAYRDPVTKRKPDSRALISFRFIITAERNDILTRQTASLDYGIADGSFAPRKVANRRVF